MAARPDISPYAPAEIASAHSADGCDGDAPLSVFADPSQGGRFIVGHPVDMDNMPLLARRQVLANQELALPYYTGYDAAIHQRLLDMLLAYVPIGLGIGSLPFTIGGLGTRDSARIYLFAPYESAAFMAGIGLLCSMRYWVDTLPGLPFFHVYSFGKGP
jgi:hypothetical protein